jgi:adenylylsulfate kinase
MAEPKGTHLTRHHGEVTRDARRRIHGHRGATLWLTGLSGSGKSTIAYRVERLLLERGCFAYVLDGDNVRHGLCADLTFSPEDRAENIRRIGEVAKLFTDAGALLLTSFISPYRRDRQRVRDGMGDGDFIEVHIATPMEVCEQRDPKGLYAKARAGEIPDFTGIGAPYEPPEAPEITVDTSEGDVDACASLIVSWLERHDYLR